MAVLAPYGLNNPKLDAGASCELSWKNGGDVQYAYDLEVYVNDGSTLPFKSYINTVSFALKMIAPANTFINGTEYKWRVRHRNQTGVIGPWSDYAIITVSAKPTVSISNVTASSTVYAQNYEFQASYSQVESVGLKSYRFYLRKNGVIVGDSGDKYDGLLKHSFENLEDGGSYTIECVAVSQNDVSGTSGQIAFLVDYTRPSSSAGIVADRIPEEAAIRVRWVNSRQIIGTFT